MIEKKTFILCFSAIVWKRIYNCALLYSDLKDVPISSDIILKCFKYNLLSQTGIVEKIKPYLIKAFTVGFLMPKEQENIYVKNAINLFGEAYKICKDEGDTQKFIISQIKEDSKEKEDIMDIREDFCNLIDVWDIEMGLISSQDPYFNLIQYFLLSYLK